MIRTGKPLYPRRTRKLQTSNIYSSFVTECLSWITFQIQQYKLITIIVCCLLAIILYYFGGNNRSFISNSHIKQSNKTHSLSFLLIGDWGANPNDTTVENQTNVANAMLEIHKKYSTKFVISVGDHFYDNGLISTNDPRWITVFENMYSSDLDPWYIAFGNHDMRGSIKAQIEYSKLSQNNRWIAPKHFYSKDFQLPHSNEEFRIIFLDTNNLMCSHEEYEELDELEQHECNETFYKHPEILQEKHGNDITLEMAIKIQEYNFKTQRSEQLLWFKNKVEDANNNDKIRFILVVGHHALFSQGPHKIPKIFDKHIQPILRLSNKIIAWFCGHNHALEHYIWDRQKHATDEKQHNEMHQFLSGSGGKEVHEMKEDPVETILDDVKLGYLGKTFGFVSVHLTSNNNMNIKYWNQYGKMLYSFTVDYPK